MKATDLMNLIEDVLAANNRAEACAQGMRRGAHAGSPEDLNLACVEGELRKVRHAMLAVKSSLKLSADIKSGAFAKEVAREAKGHAPEKQSTVTKRVLKPRDSDEVQEQP